MGMKKRIFSTGWPVFRAIGLASLVFCLTSVASGVTPAMAQQSTKKMDSELDAFKKKLAASKANATASMMKDDDKPVEGAPTLSMTPLGGGGGGLMGASPLGLAGGLPVKAPATSNALAPATPEDLQAHMDAEANEQQRKLEQQTFDAAVKQLLPMKPEQIRTLYGKFEESRKAAETPIKIPETKTHIQTISLDPNQAPPVIRMAPGYVTTISILDSSGAPWPVQDLSFAGDFDVTPPEMGGHVVRITPSSAHGVGNMSMRLVDLITPIIFTLTTSLDVVDYRFEARIAKNGPLAKTPLIEFGGLNTVAGTDGNLVAVLDGTIPQGAEKLRVQGADGRTSAWRLSGRVYLRTPLSLLSPAWDSSVASSDGTTVYTMNDTPVVLLSDEGRMVRAHIAAADEVSP